MILRQITHTLCCSKVWAQLSWVPPKLNPVEHPSTVFHMSSSTLMHTSARATFLVALKQKTPHPLFMGWASLAGSAGVFVMWPWLTDPKCSV